MDALYQLSYYEQKGKKRNTHFAGRVYSFDMLAMEGGAPANVAGGASIHADETAQKPLAHLGIKQVFVIEGGAPANIAGGAPNQTVETAQNYQPTSASVHMTRSQRSRRQTGVHSITGSRISEQAR